MSNELRLDIGSLRLAVQCDDVALVAELHKHYQAFLADETPHLTIHIQQADSDSFIDVAGGRAHLTLTTDHPLEEVDYGLRIALALLAFAHGGLLFHAAGIQRQGSGYAFFGHSGSGKTTVARLSPGDMVLNDDLVLLLPQAGGWTMHATPFTNPTQVQPSGPHCTPLTSLLRLVQDRRVYLETVSEAQAVAEVIASTPVIASDPHLSGPLLRRVGELVRAVSTYKLHFLPDASFWRVVDPLSDTACTYDQHTL